MNEQHLPHIYGLIAYAGLSGLWCCHMSGEGLYVIYTYNKFVMALEWKA